MEILLADDDQLFAARTSSLIEDYGHTVRYFPDGLSAWESFNRTPARAIIADWRMPGLDGLELCRKIRNRPQTEYVYFLLVTSAEEGDMGYDYEIGSEVDDFLLKPVTRPALWRRLRVAGRLLQFTTQIQQMESLLPICSYCHRIRDVEPHAWKTLEHYVTLRTGSDFTHTICPDCERKVEQEYVQAGFDLPPRISENTAGA